MRITASYRSVLRTLLSGGSTDVPADVNGRLMVNVTGSPSGGALLVNPTLILPRTVHLASGPLPAAGAFTSQAPYDVSGGLDEVTCWVTYTRGAAGGYPILWPMWGNGTEEGIDVAIDQIVTVSDPVGDQRVYEQQIEAPHPSGADAIVFCLPIRVPKGATTFRLLAAEAGVIATPGTMAIAIAGGR